MEVIKVLTITVSCVMFVTFASLLYLQNTTSSKSGGGKEVSTHDDHGRVNVYLPKTPSYRRFLSECGTINFDGIECDICELFVSGLKNLVRDGTTQEEIVAFATKICNLFQIEDKRVCDSITEEYKDELFGVAERLVLSPEQACSLLIGEGCSSSYDGMWNITLPNTKKPPVIPPQPPKPGSAKLRVLHLTDIHLDPAYEAGANADCGEPLCCRKGDKDPPPSGKPSAGKWGTQASCDSPLITVENLFQHLASIKDQFDYVLFTGDLPPHNVWNQSRTDQLTSLAIYTNLFKKYLPDKVVYNTLGNHESAPVNSFPPDFVKGNQSMTWLYSAVAESWGNWLPSDTMADIRKGGYYTVSPSLGFRIISLNMNVCNNGNWWLLINTTDPNGQLQWFINVLQRAEDNKEKVHVIGHIFPGGTSCLKAWSWNYYKIINRYESTIAGQFFGHSHADFYTMFYDDVNFIRPLSVLYIPGSITTFEHLNPGYRIYEIDGYYNGSTWATLDFHNYFLNLTKVNVSDKPVWEPEYSAKADYKMTNLFPADWDNLLQRMQKDDALFQKFYRHYTKMATTTPCTGDCKKKLLCDLRTGRSHDPNLCKHIYV